MSLEVKRVHLQYIFGLMTTPQKYPDFFHADAEIFRNLFTRIDEKSTYYEKERTKNPDINPSYFGEIIIEYSRIIFRTQEKASQSEKKIIEKNRNTFLNLVAWYTLPLLEAAKRKCPYMPRDWVMAFLYKINTMDHDTCGSYLKGVADFMLKVESKSWMNAYKDIGGQLGEKTQGILLILVGMFLNAYDEQKGNNSKTREDIPRNTSFDLKSLDPSVIEFMEGIENIDKLLNED